MELKPDRCYWVRGDDGLEILIPPCWGCVMDGPAACTCEIDGSSLERAERARFGAEQVVLRLRDKLDRTAERYEQALNHQRRQSREIQRLRTRVAELEGDRGH